MSLRPKSGQNQDAMEALSLIKGTCSRTTVAHQQIITLHWILWSLRVMMILRRGLIDNCILSTDIMITVISIVEFHGGCICRHVARPTW